MTRAISAKVALLVCLVATVGCSSAKPRVVLYCAQDQEFAEESLAVGSAGNLVRVSEQRRGNIADDWAGVRVIQQILNGHRNDQVIAVGGLRVANNSP